MPGALPFGVDEDQSFHTMRCGARLAALRLEQGLELWAFARDCGLHVAVVQAIEAGKQPITVEDLWRFASVLRMHPSRLLMTEREDLAQQSAYWLLDQATKKAGERAKADLHAQAAQEADPLQAMRLLAQASTLPPGTGMPVRFPATPTPTPPPFLPKKGYTPTR